ncbi:bacterial Ig-like domain-containing protein, partial [Enterococcus faecalis]
TSKAGTFDVTYTYDGVTSTATITVKEKQTAVNVHDSTIYVGDEWKAEDNFDSALNKDGEAVEFKDITVDDSQKDTSKAGTFDVTYTYDGVTSTATITVKEKNISNEKSTVVVQYVDENGNKISNDTILTGNNGEKYQTKAKKIKGYTLSKTPENSEGEFSDKEISVTYIYKKEDDGEINIINQKDTNSHTGASSKQNQSVFPKTGEKSSTLITITGTALLFLISSLFLIKRKNRRDN